MSSELTNLTIAELMRANERVRRDDAGIDVGLDEIVSAIIDQIAANNGVRMMMRE